MKRFDSVIRGLVNEGQGDIEYMAPESFRAIISDIKKMELKLKNSLDDLSDIVNDPTKRQFGPDEKKFMSKVLLVIGKSHQSLQGALGYYDMEING